MSLFDRKVCLITGASSGFGRHVAIELARKGATVVVAARREAKLRELVEELGGEPHGYVVCDVGDLASIRSMMASIAERYGRIDVLVNNAGVATSGPVSRTDSESMESVIRTNLLGAMWCTREGLDLLREAPVGDGLPVVVNVASIAGRIAIPKSADYVASKFGLVGFTESSWYDLRQFGIRTMVVNPGLAHTEGFPMDAVRRSPLTGWAVMDADRVAKALVRGIESGSFEVRVQWWLHPVYWMVTALGPLRRAAVRVVRGRFDTDL